MLNADQVTITAVQSCEVKYCCQLDLHSIHQWCRLAYACSILPLINV